MTLQRGRWTHDHDGDVVVFVIGMRVNRPWAVRAWWPVLTAMRPMVEELYADPSSGLLGHRSALGAGGPFLVQYWRDLDSLLAFARDPERSHRPAWRAFSALARGSGGAVGIWHETYVVRRGAHESVSHDMPLHGLARATRAVPLRGGGSARDRLVRPPA